jgi:hypothetical protein
MSDVLPLRRTRFFTRAGAPDPRNRGPVGPSRRIENLIMINR